MLLESYFFTSTTNSNNEFELESNGLYTSAGGAGSCGGTYVGGEYIGGRGYGRGPEYGAGYAGGFEYGYDNDSDVR